ncbi:hypothetical protein B4Q04_20130 [Zobellia sp. OII3]|uniref:hypothetical protein n=1 Tax=Zobellia sp. OII3 TaxID=2034520 RepID=UPI000B52E5EB|nr:hypothetical protein [Zobellia sp. OII3]OWW23509.1 hypothetical protein B4Q04_20130 [Zobellia sp. OII3]
MFYFPWRIVSKIYVKERIALLGKVNITIPDILYCYFSYKFDVLHSSSAQGRSSILVPQKPLYLPFSLGLGIVT